MRLLAALIGAALAAILAVPGGSLYFESGGGKRCTSCHEMQPNFDAWHTSSHRNVSCAKCHEGESITNLKRAAAHLRKELPEQINLASKQVEKTNELCEPCHRNEYASWKASRHSATYSRIFLDQKHNTKHMLMDDCLRCHGMYFEGGIRELVMPVARTGPWTITHPEIANTASMPCLTCHEMHRAKPSLAFYDRRTERHVPVADLSIPAIREGERPVRMSPDQRQALCYQCHAPTAGMQVGTGDDRTGLGVHEGISCLGCHKEHGESAKESCKTCHPKMSNCGLDVEKMDTTFFSKNSKHNVHWVKCGDCHANRKSKRYENSAPAPD